jgi:hypothetical protein
LLVILLPGFIAGTARAAGEVISGQRIWQGDVHVAATVVVERGAILRIRPGTRIFLSGEDSDEDGARDGSIIVFGTLIVEGAREKPVLFSRLDPARPWGEVYIKEGKAVIRFAVFEGAKWGLHVHDGDVKVEHAVFRGNGGGARLKGTGAAFSRCTFRRNGIALRFWDGGPTVADTVIENNGVGLFYREGPGGGKIVRSLIANREWNLKIGDWASGDLDASGNYWGTGEEKEVRHRIQDFRENIHGQIRVSPFLPTPPAGCGAGLPEDSSIAIAPIKGSEIGEADR